MLGWQAYIRTTPTDTEQQEFFCHWEAELGHSLPKYVPDNTPESGNGYPYTYKLTPAELAETFHRMSKQTISQFYTYTKDEEGMISRIFPPFTEWAEQLTNLNPETQLTIEEWDKS